MVDVGFLGFQNQRLRYQKQTKNLANLKVMIHSLLNNDFMQKADIKKPPPYLFFL